MIVCVHNLLSLAYYLRHRKGVMEYIRMVTDVPCQLFSADGQREVYERVRE